MNIKDNKLGYFLYAVAILSLAAVLIMSASCSTAEPATYGSTETSPIFITEIPAVNDDEMAAIHRGTNQSIANGSYVSVSYSAELFDTAEMIDIIEQPTQILVRSDGKYLITTAVNFNTNATGVRRSRIRANGTTTLAGNMVIPNALEGTMVLVVVVVELSENDYIETQLYQTSGGALNILTGDFDTPLMTVTKIGS